MMFDKRSDRVQTHYVTLGVATDASPADLKRAYRELVRKAHPDRFMNTSNEDLLEAEEHTKLLNGAYGILSDANLRTEYDRELSSQPNAQATQSRKAKAENEQEESSYFPGVVPHPSDFFPMAAEFLHNPPWEPKDSGPPKEDRELAERVAQAQAALNLAEEEQLFKDWIPGQRPSTGVWRTRPYFS